METTVRDDVRAAVARLVAQAGSQSAFARATGWPQPFVSRFLNGQVGLSMQKARDLVAAYPEMRPAIERELFEEDAAPA